MKRFFTVLSLAFLISFSANAQCGDMYIAGVIDGPLPLGTPKGIQICATAAIPDVSIYGVGSANNGGGTDGEELTFSTTTGTGPGVLAAGECFWVGNSNTADAFTAWFGFAPCYESSAGNLNGDDAIELFCSGSVIDTFGDINVDGSGEPWDYLDGWAKRTGSTTPGTFNLADWTFSGINALDGEADNATAASPYPAPEQVCPAPIPTLGEWALLCLGLTFLSFGLVAIREEKIELVQA